MNVAARLYALIVSRVVGRVTTVEYLDEMDFWLCMVCLEHGYFKLLKLLLEGQSVGGNGGPAIGPGRSR